MKRLKQFAIDMLMIIELIAMAGFVIAGMLAMAIAELVKRKD